MALSFAAGRGARPSRAVAVIIIFPLLLLLAPLESANVHGEETVLMDDWHPSVPLPGWSTSPLPPSYGPMLAEGSHRACLASDEPLRMPWALRSRRVSLSRDFKVDDMTVLGGGEGNFCTILSAEVAQSTGLLREGEAVAIKVARDDRPGSPDLDEHVLRETDILAKLNHNLIVRSLGHGFATVSDAKETGANPWLNWHKPFLVMEYIPGKNLKQVLTSFDLPQFNAMGYILRRRVLPINRVLHIASQVAQALDYLHEFESYTGIPVKILHRDIKPENIMLLGDEKDSIKLIDFSLAKVIPLAPNHHHESGMEVAPSPKAMSSRLGSYNCTGDIGMVRYMAPEVHRQELYNEKVDVYGLCLVLWEMMSLIPPYGALIDESLGPKWRDRWKEEVVKGGHRPHLRADWNDQVHRVFQGCWHEDPAVRMSARELKEALDGLRSSGSQGIFRTPMQTEGGTEYCLDDETTAPRRS